MPKVTVRYFATLRERRGVEEERLELPAASTPAGVWAQLFGHTPLAPLRVMFAINQRYADPDTPLADGDELAFIPPLGGG